MNINHLDIISFRDRNNLSQVQLAEILEVDSRTVQNYEAGKKIPPKKVKKISDLINKYETTRNISHVNEPASSYNPTISHHKKGAPYYDLDFVGGFDAVLNDQTISPEFYIDFKPYNDVDCWVNITGKSMSPFISHGDILALKRMTQWDEFLLFGEIYAVVTDEYRTVKIIGAGDDSDHFTLTPYNKSEEFSKQPIPKRMINHIFRVKGSIKRFF